MRSAIAVAAVLLAATTAARGLEVPLTVEEPVGAERTAEVVSGGIPLPKGACKDPAAFSLADGTPVQVSPMFKYPDGSLHWVLVSFPVKLGANEKKTFTLKDAPGAATPANPVTVKEAGDKITVSNGLVGFTIDKTNFNGFESVTYKDKKIFQAAEAGLVANGKGGPGKLTHFEYRYRGPIRTTLYLKGTYGGEKAPTWAMAVTLNANESAIHLDHNLRNGGLGAKTMTPKVLEMRLGLAGKLEAAGGDAPKPRRGHPAYGWKTFAGDADVTVFLRHGAAGPKFVPAYEAAVKDGTLVISMSGHAKDDYWLAYGAHKITEIDLVFGKDTPPLALAEPLHALAPCAWYSEHDGMGVGRGFGSLEDETQAYKNYNLKGAGEAKRMPNEKADPNIFRSWLDTHGTSEADQLRGLTLGYVRTGQRGFLDRAAAWVRFYRNYYYWRTDDFTFGKEGSQKIGKWVPGRWCGCHGYGVGMFNYALLTGNIDALEAAFEGAEIGNASYGTYSRTKPGDGFSWWGSRGFARPYAVVARAYDVTRNEEWRRALVHITNVATKTKMRDPRGFTNHGIISTWTQKKLGEIQNEKKGSPDAAKLYKEEGTEIFDHPTAGKGMCRHPKYGEWHPRCVGTWVEAIESMANHTAYASLAESDDPAAQAAAEDAMDYAIAEAWFSTNWVYDKHIKQIYYYFYVDFPIPGYVPIWKGGRWAKPRREIAMNYWYTQWFPDAAARGYALTGEKHFLDTAMEMWREGRARDYWTLPKAADDEIRGYAFISWNTKGDWISTSALTFGLAARPRKDAEPPKAVADLAAKALGGGKVELTWTSPADGGGGKTGHYQVKWAKRPLADYPVDGDAWRKGEWWRGKTMYWNMANNIAGEPLPQPPGKTEKMVVTAEPGKCWFAVRGFDDSHNRSTMSNVVEVEVQ